MECRLLPSSSFLSLSHYAENPFTATARVFFASDYASSAVIRQREMTRGHKSSPRERWQEREPLDKLKKHWQAIGRT